jgi:hypothetical protein
MGFAATRGGKGAWREGEKNYQGKNFLIDHISKFIYFDFTFFIPAS